MTIFVIGAGFTGMQLAKMLVLERNKVVLIDNDAEKVRHASDALDCTVIEADGNSIDVLEQAGIASANAFVALTGDDEVNMIACQIVDSAYPDILKIARVRNYAYYSAVDSASRRKRTSSKDTVRAMYGMDAMINPDVEAASAIHRAVEYGAVGNIIDLKNDFMLTTLGVGSDSVLVGRCMRELPGIDGWDFLVAFAEPETGALIPRGDTVINAGDTLGVVSRTADVAQVAQFADATHETFRRIVIFGADRVGSMLIPLIAEKRRGTLWQMIFGGKFPESSREVIVVDRNAARCHEIAERHPNVRVLCGDITDEALMSEEDLYSCDLIVAASGNYELNLVTAAYMKSKGANKAVALTASTAYGAVARKLGIDVAVPMRGTVVDSILSHLRGRNVSAIHSVCNRSFEIVEGDISDKSRFAGKKLRDLVELDGEFLLLLSKDSNGVTAIPNGDTTLEAGSHVVLIVRSGNTELLARICGK